MHAALADVPDVEHFPLDPVPEPETAAAPMSITRILTHPLTAFAFTHSLADILDVVDLSMQCSAA